MERQYTFESRNGRDPTQRAANLLNCPDPSARPVLSCPCDLASLLRLLCSSRVLRPPCRVVSPMASNQICPAFPYCCVVTNDESGRQIFTFTFSIVYDVDV